MDVSHVAEGDVDLYMQIAQKAVQVALITPPGNPQIRAVVLMTTPILLPGKFADGTEVRVRGRRSLLVSNGVLPEGLIIPGAPQESKSVAQH